MKKKPNCEQYDNCVGCEYLKKVVATIKNKNDEINDETLYICEYNGTIDEIFSTEFDENFEPIGDE